MADAWQWAALMADGSRVEEPEAQTFGKVDLGACVGVELRRTRGIVRRPVSVSVDLGRGERAVFKRIRTVAVSVSGGTVHQRTTLTVAGWEGPEGRGYLVAEDSGRLIFRSSLEGL